MIHTINHSGLHTESFSTTTDSQRRVLAHQIWRERKRGFIVSPIKKHECFAVIRKDDLQAIKRIDLDPRLCYGAGRRQSVSQLKQYTIS
jgi:hypothetical protein